MEQPLVVDTGWLVSADGFVRPGLSLLIEGGRITAIESATVLAAVEGVRHMGGAECLALPGFTNAHQHGRSADTAALGIADAPLECWLVSLLAAPSVDIYAETRRVCQRMAVGGVTTLVHSHFSTATTAEAYERELRAILTGYRDGGVRSYVAVDIRDRGLPVYGNAEGFLRQLPHDLRSRALSLIPGTPPAHEVFEVVEGLRQEAESGTLGDVRIIYGPPGLPWCSDDLLARVAKSSERHDAPVHMHLLESPYQRAWCDRNYPEGAVEALRRLGLLNRRLSVAHGVWLDPEETRALAEAEATVVTNPSSNLRLHSGVAALPELIAEGVNVALGTDNMSLAGDHDFLAEMRLLRAIHRRPGIDEFGLDAATLLALLTENANVMLRASDRSDLCVGARGDIVLVNLSRLDGIPGVANLLDFVLSTASRANFEAVIAGGHVLVERGQYCFPFHEQVGETYTARPEAGSIAEELIPFVRAYYRDELSRPPHVLEHPQQRRQHSLGSLQRSPRSSPGSSAPRAPPRDRKSHA